jgi:Mg2+ and Co2+ transporter CorA
MAMAWTQEQQQRFDELRRRELTAPLQDAEQRELWTLQEALEAEEARYLAPALEQMQREQEAGEQALLDAQRRNEELAQLAQQHEQLIGEAHQWLTQFDQRRLVLQERFNALTGEPSRPSRR